MVWPNTGVSWGGATGDWSCHIRGSMVLVRRAEDSGRQGRLCSRCRPWPGTPSGPGRASGRSPNPDCIWRVRSWWVRRDVRSSTKADRSVKRDRSVIRSHAVVCAVASAVHQGLDVTCGVCPEHQRQLRPIQPVGASVAVACDRDVGVRTGLLADRPATATG